MSWEKIESIVACLRRSQDLFLCQLAKDDIDG